MSATACNTYEITAWLGTVFCSLLLAAGAQAEGAVKKDSDVPGPAFVLNDNLKTSIWWAVSPYFSSSPNLTGSASVVADRTPGGVETHVGDSTKYVGIAGNNSVDIADNSSKSVDIADSSTKSVDIEDSSTKSVENSIVLDLSPNSPSRVPGNSDDGPEKARNDRNSVIYVKSEPVPTVYDMAKNFTVDVRGISGTDYIKLFGCSVLLKLFLTRECAEDPHPAYESLKGSTCQSMSSPGDGVCTPINDCLMYDDIKDALINNTTLPYYFDSVHDKMACGFADGPKTLICCEEAPLEIPPSMNILPPPYCGVQVTSTTRVVGGKPVNVPGTYPWLTELGYNRTNGNQSWECAGALITERHVLTVAHCAFPKGLVMTKARIGALTLDSAGSEYWQERTVIEVRAHPEYNSSTKKHDIAIAVLANKVELTRFVHPICLPFTADMKKMTFEKKHPFIAGWGRVSYAGAPSDRLLQIQLAVRSNEECQSVYKKWNRMIYPTQMCAGEGDGVHDACRGDSGAPLMQPIGNFYYVIGLVSFGYYCAVKGYPSVNTRVTEYIDWIAENIYDPI